METKPIPSLQDPRKPCPSAAVGARAPRAAAQARRSDRSDHLAAACEDRVHPPHPWLILEKDFRGIFLVLVNVKFAGLHQMQVAKV